MVKRSLVEHYKWMLKKGKKAKSGGLEGGAESAHEDFSRDDVVDERIETTRDELHHIVKEFLGDKDELYEIANQIAEVWQESLACGRGR